MRHYGTQVICAAPQDVQQDQGAGRQKDKQAIVAEWLGLGAFSRFCEPTE